MFHTILGLILLTPTVLTQMDSIKPDVSFTGNNDRFDLSGMMSVQNKMFRDTPLIDDDEDEGVASDADYRRDLRSDAKGILKLLNAFKSKHPSHAFLTRREEPDFAYDPDNLPTIGRAGEDNMMDLEYQENLKQFKMNIPKLKRRNTRVGNHKHEDDIIMQNVVPILLKVDGYLKAPLQELTLLSDSQGKKVVSI